jgi:hypothetical protein
MKSKHKKFVPLLERLTPKQLAEFRRGMAALRQKFQRRMKRRQNVRPHGGREKGRDETETR